MLNEPPRTSPRTSGTALEDENPLSTLASTTEPSSNCGGASPRSSKLSPWMQCSRSGTAVAAQLRTETYSMNAMTEPAPGPPDNGSKVPHELLISLLSFENDGYTERQLTLSDLDSLDLAAGDGVRWLEVRGKLDEAALQRLSSALQLHPITQEHLIADNQRPTMAIYNDYVAISMRYLLLRDRSEGHANAADDGHLISQQLSLLLREGLLLTFDRLPGEPYASLKERLRHGYGASGSVSADYLAYEVMDLTVDGFFKVLEAYGDELERLEEKIVKVADRNSLTQISRLRRRLRRARRAIWPLREVMAELRREEVPFFSRNTAAYLRDVQGNVVQAIETLETLRDMVTDLHDLYLTTINLRMNDIMKVLTVIATIFIPLTFLTGIYGMNFDHMPEYHWRWSYPLLLLVMLALAAWMLRAFRRRGWI